MINSEVLIWNLPTFACPGMRRAAVCAMRVWSSLAVRRSGGYLVSKSGSGPDNGVAFTGEVKLARKATGQGKKSRSAHHPVAGSPVRGPSLPAPIDRITDPRIPLTRH